MQNRARGYPSKPTQQSAGFFPKALSTRFNTLIGQYVLLFVLVIMILAAILGLIYTQESVLVSELSPAVDALLSAAFLKLFAVLVLASASVAGGVC